MAGKCLKFCVHAIACPALIDQALLYAGSLHPRGQFTGSYVLHVVIFSIYIQAEETSFISNPWHIVKSLLVKWVGSSPLSYRYHSGGVKCVIGQKA